MWVSASPASFREHRMRATDCPTVPNPTIATFSKTSAPILAPKKRAIIRRQMMARESRSTRAGYCTRLRPRSDAPTDAS